MTAAITIKDGLGSGRNAFVCMDHALVTRPPYNKIHYGEITTDNEVITLFEPRRSIEEIIIQSLTISTGNQVDVNTGTEICLYTAHSTGDTTALDIIFKGRVGRLQTVHVGDINILTPKTGNFILAKATEASVYITIAYRNTPPLQ